MTLPNHDPIVARAAEHMVRTHGRHAADFATYRSRELLAQGAVEAAELWRHVSRAIADQQAETEARLPEPVA
jgi:hypothetical protein